MSGRECCEASKGGVVTGGLFLQGLTLVGD